MKDKKISLSQMFRLNREFSMTKTEREQLRILKKERQEDIRSYLIENGLIEYKKHNTKKSKVRKKEKIK